MPAANLLCTGIPDAMKADEGTDSLDTFIRQVVGKEPLFSFSRTGDSPVSWIQLLHALDQQDLPGWPLLVPMKVQVQKCDKCVREFCSPINFRRHIRVHRRSLNFYKEPKKYRDLLGAFWDKLSYDEAKEIMSFNDVNLEEVPGSSIVRNISANLREPMFLSLPQVYVKAGTALVDIIQGRTSRLPISSQELFSILEDASERTFLCAGTAESLQKYVFDGEAGKIGLEMKNLIACTSFLVEQKLVKAWVADKDAEALRCQKLLVEEEEAAQKRQAELLERKRQRKLRQKEHRVRDQLNGVKVDDVYDSSNIFEGIPCAEASSPQSSAEVDPFIPDENFLMPHEPTQLSYNENWIDVETQGGCSSEHSDSATGRITEHHKVQWNGFQHFVTGGQVPKSQKVGRKHFHGHLNVNTLKWEQSHKRMEQRAALVNGSKVWTKKPKSEYGRGELVQSRVQNDAINQTNQNNCQLMIGSISVTVRNCPRQHKVNILAEIQESINMDVHKNSVRIPTNRSIVKFWRPRHDTRRLLSDRSSSVVPEHNATLEKEADQTLPTVSCHSWELSGNDSKGTNDSHPQVEDGAKQEAKPFSIDTAKAFLAQRWKEAASGEHVKLVLSSVPEIPGEPDARNDHQAPKSVERMVLGSAENRLGNMAVVGSSAKFMTKAEKGMKTKYIPKQRATN